MPRWQAVDAEVVALTLPETSLARSIPLLLHPQEESGLETFTFHLGAVSFYSLPREPENPQPETSYVRLCGDSIPKPYTPS